MLTDTIHEPPPAHVLRDRQTAFLAFLPAIETHARHAFRHLRCPFDREDAVADAVAFAWSKFRVLPRHIDLSAKELAAEAVTDVRMQIALEVA